MSFLSHLRKNAPTPCRLRCRLHETPRTKTMMSISLSVFKYILVSLGCLRGTPRIKAIMARLIYVFRCIMEYILQMQLLASDPPRN